MTRFSVERLENAKYLGVPGLGSLQQFMTNADSYNLKYVFANDDFYDPLLHFTGWVRLNRLPNGVTVWEKPAVTALPAVTPRRAIPASHMLLWGTLPPFMLLSAAAIFLFGALRRGFGAHRDDPRPVEQRPEVFTSHARVRLAVLTCCLGVLVAGVGSALWIARAAGTPAAPEKVIQAYFDDLDFRRYQAAYGRLDPVTRPEFEAVMFNWRWRGGLIASYGKLRNVEALRVSGTEEVAEWDVTLHWLTSLGLRQEQVRLQMVRRDADWYVTPTVLRATQTPARLQRGGSVDWNVVGRRQPRQDTDLHRDRLDRPRLWLDGVRLVERNGRYSVIGAVTNADSDPAMVSLLAGLATETGPASEQWAGEVNGQRLLPAETSGFRIDFEGVLSLDAEEAAGGFDPTLFIPPELPGPPTGANMEARALVSTSELYRGVALNGIRISDVDGAPVIEGTAVNIGTRTATVTRIIALLHDESGQPVWAEAGYVDANIYPGQSAPFRLVLPARDEIRVIAEVPADRTLVNGSTQQQDIAPPASGLGTIPVDIAGYSSVRLHVSSMTYDPLF